MDQHIEVFSNNLAANGMRDLIAHGYRIVNFCSNGQEGIIVLYEKEKGDYYESFAQIGVGINPWIANKVPPASKITYLGFMAV